MMVAQTFLTGRAIARFGEERTVLIGLAVGALVFAGYAFVREGWQVYALIALGALPGWSSRRSTRSCRGASTRANQGALQGGMASLASVAAIIGPLAMTQALAFGAERGLPGGGVRARLACWRR